MNYAELVDQRLLNELQSFTASIGKSNIYESLSNATKHISVSYKGRTLIELIQNGYDPHPADQSNGEISILLDVSETEHGCLYVANRGNGFAPENFDGICDIARSPKVVNKGIGNKGLGFRGVLQVCQHPEIYSQAGAGRPADDFDGFRFTFPEDKLLARKLASSPYAKETENILDKVPRSLLPIYLDETPDRVRDFAKKGFATVIRMPLSKNDAADDIREQINEICGDEVPVHLFLERLSKIQIEIIEEDEEPIVHSLTRVPKEIWLDDGVAYSLITINSDQSFLVAKVALPDKEFRPYLDDGIENEQLPAEWSDWDGAAEISVAAATSGNNPIGRLYNFLPMESTAPSPFAGHVNAPFYCDIDRTKLVDNTDLNDYFLKATAKLCLKVIDSLKTDQPELARALAVDLVIWTQDYWETLDKAANSDGGTLKELTVIPSCEGSKNFPWTSIENLSNWPDGKNDLEVISRRALASVAKIDFVCEEIAESATERLDDILWLYFDIDPNPDFDSLAQWTVKLAAKLLEDGNAISRWNQFYRDLALLFSENASALNGQSILLTENLSLAEALRGEKIDDEPAEKPKKRRTQGIFLPSTRKSTDDDREDETEEADEGDEENLFRRIPSSLAKSIQLVHHELKLAQKKDDSGARSFLLQNRLVNSFQRGDLQRVLANLTENPGPGANADYRRYDALMLSFELTDGSAHLAELDQMPFHVPARAGGWIAARNAYFGSDWPRTRGKVLEALIDAANSASPELSQVKSSFILGYKEWPKKSGKSTEWIKFLRKIGLADTLRITNSRPRGAFRDDGRFLRGNVLDKCVKSEVLREYWAEDLPIEIEHPYTPYTVKQTVPTIPGLNDYWAFSTIARRLYAEELIRVLAEQGEAILTLTIFRPQHPYQPKEAKWPSPVASFLTHVDWLPTTSEQTDCRFLRPADLWHAPRQSTYTRASFLPIVSGECRDLLDAKESVLELLQEYCELKVIDSPTSATAQVSELGRLGFENRIPSMDIPIFDEAYAEGWHLLSNNEEALTETLDSDEFCLAAHVNDEIVGYQLAHAENTDDGTDSQESLDEFRIYVADDVSPTRRDLLKEMGQALFDFKFQSRAKVASVLCARFCGLERVSEVTLSVYVDGTLFDSQTPSEYLISSERRWLQDMLIVICALSGAFMSLGQSAQARIRATLSSIRLCLVEAIDIEVDGERRTLPSFLQGCLAMQDTKGPLILIKSPDDTISWDKLQRAAYCIAETLNAPNQLSPVFASAFAHLSATQGPHAFYAPTQQDYQVICRKGAHTIAEALRGLRHIIESMLELLKPVIHSEISADSFEEVWSALAKAESEAQIAETLSVYQSQISIDADKLFDACRLNDSPDGVRRNLEIELKTFNNALEELGPPYSILDFTDEHRIAFRSFVSTNSAAVLNSLRSAFVSAFDHRENLGDYVTARRMEDLVQSSSWGTQYDDLPEQLLLDCINNWLSSKGAAPINEIDALDGIEAEDCRDQNRCFLNKWVKESWPILATWCRRNSIELPEIWRNQKDAGQHVAKQAHNEGWLDFRILNPSIAIAYLEKSAAWPASMPHTTDPETLGITLEQIESNQHAESARQIERERQANTILVSDQELSLQQPDLIESLTSICALYEGNDLLWKGNSRLARLDPIAEGKKGKSGGRGTGGSKGGRHTKLPPSQTDAIGLLGEKLAFEWLKKQYPEIMDESCWVSGNRERALQSEPGDDSLGYDFKIQHPSYVGYYEVKATSTNEGFFRMGPTEVAAAIRYSKGTKYRYQILFIENVTDPKHARLWRLPNPYGEQGRERFKIVRGGEVALSFSLPDKP